MLPDAVAIPAHLATRPIVAEIDRHIVELARMPYASAGYRFAPESVVVYGTGPGVSGFAESIFERSGLPGSVMDVARHFAVPGHPVPPMTPAEMTAFAEPLGLAWLELEKLAAEKPR